MAVHLAVAGDLSWCHFVLSFLPRDDLDEMWDLTESVPENFPTYSCTRGILETLTKYTKINTLFTIDDYTDSNCCTIKVN